MASPSPLRLLYTITLLFLYSILSAPVSALAVETSPKRPIYAIAHRVLQPSSVTAALDHGANALEIDLTAWNFEWWADHDGKLWSSGSMAIELFRDIARKHQASTGGGISFVWLDIKNPDYCASGRACSIEGLQKIVREVLEPVGIRALYGFFGTEESRGFKVVRDSLNHNEAIVLSGSTGEVLEMYEDDAPLLEARKRVMDYGGVRVSEDFGTCDEDDGTCTELRRGGNARDRGELGRIMGWTTGQGDTEEVDKMLGVAGVDGIIYGFPEAEYADEPGARAAFRDIEGFVDSHSETHCMATRDDHPW